MKWPPPSWHWYAWKSEALIVPCDWWGGGVRGVGGVVRRAREGRGGVCMCVYTYLRELGLARHDDDKACTHTYVCVLMRKGRE